MSSDSSSLEPIRPVAERRAGAPLPVPDPEAPSPDAYDYPTKRRRPAAGRTGTVRTMLSLPEATRMALDRARLQKGMPPLSEIVNEACVQYLRREGVIS